LKRAARQRSKVSDRMQERSGEGKKMAGPGMTVRAILIQREQAAGSAVILSTEAKRGLP